MSVKLTGLEALKTRIRRTVADTSEITHARRQREARDVIRYGERISPVRTGRFKKSWEDDVPRDKTGFQIRNEATEDGRLYGPYVHRRGESVTVLEEVEQEARRRAPQLAEDLAQIVSDHINQG